MSSYAGLGGGGGLGLIGLNMVMGPNGSSSSRKSRGKVAGSVGNRATGDAQKIGNIQTENPGVHGIHQSMDGGGSPHGNALQWKNGRQYLAYSPQEVPYPRSYDKIAIDHDTTNHLFLNRLRNGLTWHEFNPEPSGFSAPSSSLNKEPQSSVKSSKSHTETETGSMSWKPNNILDLGCGNGVWILDAANLWPDAMFTGLDIAPIQPSLSLLAPRLAKRIQWVNANFLEQLPFPTSHFDFVRICRIARGVPEHKWKEFFKEVSRVLKPGGALEVFEEDLVFPGGAEKVRHPPLVTKINYGEESARSSPGSLRSSSNASTIRYRSTLSSLEQAYKDMHHERRISLRPISILSNILPAFFHEVQSHPPVLMTFPPPEEEIWSDSSSSASDSDVSARSRRIVRHNVAKGEQSRRAVTYRSSTISRLSTIASSIAYSMGSSGVDSSASGSPPQLSPRELHMDETQRETLDIDTGGEHSPTSTLSRRQQEYASDQPISYTNAPTKESFHHPTANAADSKNTAGGSISPLMNPVYNLDLHSLTLSLALNATDVLECKESIWDFMVQAGHSKPLKQPTRLHEAANEETSIGGHHGEKELSPSNRKRSHSDSSSLPRLSLDTTASDKSFITREEFDQWFIDYEEEMHGRLQLAKALQSRLNWRTRGLTSADSGLATSQYLFFHLNSTPLNRESLGSSSLGVGDIVLAPEQPPSDWPFALSLSDVEDGGTVSPPFSNSSSTSLWYEEGNSEEGGTAEYSPDNMSHQSDEKDKSTIHDEDRSEVFSSRPHRQSPPKAKDRRAHSRIRSHTGDVQPRRLRTHHSRGYSLDAANAWKLLAQENSHLGPLSLGTKSILRSPHATKQVSENKSDVWNEHLPGLSRCVKVFVARNSKTE